MKRKMFFIPLLILAFISKPSFSSQAEPLSLSLEDCILKALENNLQVAVEVYNPELADVSLTRAKEEFMPRFDLSYGSEQTESPSYWWIQGAETVATDYMDYSVSILQNIPTGGQFSLSLSGYKSDSNQSFQLINPRFGNTLRFNFIQPLLRNFGFKVSRKEILLAQNNFDISLHQLQSVLLETIYRVQQAYWNLVYAIENHKVKNQSLKLARDLLAKSKKEVEVGKLAPIEILNAQAVVASREADILQAEALIRSNEDLLKNIINISEEVVSPQKIVPVDEPTLEEREISLEEALSMAYQKRPDLKMKKTDIENKELNLGVAKNQMLPGLDLNFSYWSPGLSGDRLIYLHDNPLTGVVVGKEEGSAANSLRDALNLLYNNWSVSVTLSLPLSNILTRADYVRAKMELEKSHIELENTQKQALLEVKDAVREIETSAKRVQAYRVARELAEKRLEAEEKKLKVGLTTNYFVLQYQEELANARSQELKALVDYNLAWAKLEKALGISLDKRNISISRFSDSEQ
ncbi:MAG: TolC family protein [Candidatus Aminicenantes bacterium]